jgi:hypothetical protein
MKEFYCNGKKDICNDDTMCYKCKYFDGSGVQEINVSLKHAAIKEFAERLKEKQIKPVFPWNDFFVTEGIIDEVLKEMVGDTDA